MMKVSMKAVMTKAWQIKRMNKDNDFALCLKWAWEIVRSSKQADLSMLGGKATLVCADEMHPVLVIAVSGDTYANKDALQAAGAAWNVMARRWEFGEYKQYTDAVAAQLELKLHFGLKMYRNHDFGMGVYKDEVLARVGIELVRA